MFHRKKQVTFLCEQDKIADLNASGEFSIENIKRFTQNTGSLVIIKDYGLIEKGKLSLIN